MKKRALLPMLILTYAVCAGVANSGYIYHYQRCEDILAVCKKKYSEDECKKYYDQSEQSGYWGKSRCYTSKEASGIAPSGIIQEIKKCEAPRVSFVAGGTTEAVLRVPQGSICDVHFQNNNSDKANFGIYSSEVLSRPRNGLLGKTSIRHYAYKPSSTYLGDDDFTIFITYDNRDAKSTTTLHYAVKVE